MKKILFLFSAIMMLAMGTQKASAQQTLQQATDSVKTIYELAKKGDAAAQNQVGYWYFMGTHVKQNYEEAVKWWLLSGKQNNPYALGNLGICYQAGFGVEPDSAKAVKLFDRALKEGYTSLFPTLENLADEDMFYASYVASCYKRGIGTKRNPGKAAIYFEKCANQGSVPAMVELGSLYRETNKPEKAYEWYEKAAKFDNPVAIYYCGDMLQKGEGVEQDKEKGFNLILRAADDGVRTAQFDVARCYYTGDGTVKNENLGAQWLAKAANQGLTKAQYQLGLAYALGEGVEENYENACAWIAVATQTGFQKQFQEALSTGKLADSNFLTYLRTLKMIADGDFDGALKQIKILEKAKLQCAKTLTATVLLDSNYKKNNEKKGIKTLEEAVKAGDPVAMYMLALRYESGKGVERDPSKALSLLEKSSEAGYYLATCYLGDIYYEGRDVAQDYKKAVELYTSVEALLTSSAAKRLAYCYEKGRGVKQDLDKAKKISQMKPADITTLFQYVPALPESK